MNKGIALVSDPAFGQKPRAQIHHPHLARRIPREQMQVLRVGSARIAALVILMDQPVLFAPYSPSRELTYSLRIDLPGFMRFVDIIWNVERSARLDSSTLRDR